MQEPPACRPETIFSRPLLGTSLKDCWPKSRNWWFYFCKFCYVTSHIYQPRNKNKFILQQATNNCQSRWDTGHNTLFCLILPVRQHGFKFFPAGVSSFRYRWLMSVVKCAFNASLTFWLSAKDLFWQIQNNGERMKKSAPNRKCIFIFDLIEIFTLKSVSQLIYMCVRSTCSICKSIRFIGELIYLSESR